MTDTQPSVRHFRQILLWPLSLTPLRASAQVQHHWQTFLTGPGAGCAWEPREAEWNKEDGRFEERHYREFVTFLPHVQRFLYGQTRGKRVGHGYGEAPMRVFRRRDIAHVRIHLEDEVHTFQVQHVDLYFFHDVDVAMLALELHGSNLRLASVQDLLYRFGRIYPVMWDDAGRPLQCVRNVEWLSHAGEVLAESDFHDRERFLDHACEHRNARVGAHWEFMLWPMVPEQSERPGSLRYRQLDYYRLPKLTYLALDDPFQLTREDFYRLGMASAPDDGLGFPHPEETLEAFERERCYDHFWVPTRRDMRSSTRIVCTARSMVVVGCALRPSFTHAATGVLGQFRHQYFLLAMIAQFHHAALLMLSDRMVLAVSRLEAEDRESVERFRKHIRDTTEIFLRFNHRYWFHEVSKQSIAKDLFRMWSEQLGNDALFEEVREEVLDMGQYLDSDAARRQSDIVLRLTVVTILGLIGTIATGFLGMNLIDETQQPLLVKLGVFLAVMVPSVGLTLLTVLKSGRLARLIDTLADERLDTRAKLREVRHLFTISKAPTSSHASRRSPRLQRGVHAHRRFHAESLD